MKVAAIMKTLDLKMIEVEKPSPAEDQVLVKVAYCGLCATDYDNYTGATSFAKEGQLKYPLRFGHEWSGVIVEVGSDVKDFQVGDKVIGDGKVTCNVCENCKQGKWYDCMDLRAVGTVKDHWPGAMAEYILMPARNVFKIASDVSLREAAVAEPFIIAMNGLRETDLEGKIVLVIGSGPIGLGGIIAAKVKGAKYIICAARSESKLQKALDVGATHIINIVKDNLQQKLFEITGGKKADFVLEASGCVDYVENCTDYVANMGTMAMVAFYDRAPDKLNLDTIVFGKITLRGCSGAREYTPIVADLLSQHVVNLAPLISDEIDFADIESAMERYKQTASTRIKLLVRIGGEELK